MSNNNIEPLSDIEIKNRLMELREIPARNPLQAASGRARFLREAADYRQSISPETNERQKGWTFPIRKEKLSMNALVSLILVAFLLLGGGATVAAAQDDLPNQPLYQLKLWTENTQLALNGDPQEQANLLMDMAQTRLQEMTALTEMGVTPPDQVRDRLQQHLDQVLQLAIDMGPGTRDQVLLQLQGQLQTEDRIMEQLQLHVNAASKPQLSQTREVLRTHLQLVNKGLEEPQGLQNMLENQMRHGQDEEMPPGLQQQGEPGSPQNNGNGRPADPPGNGNGNPHQDKTQDGNPSGKGNDGSQGQNPGNQQGGMDGQNSNGSGGGGGNP